MSRKWKFGLLLFFLLGIILTTPFFGRVETKFFSAYSSCRSKAIVTKGYAIWKHKNTEQMAFSSLIFFSDGYNHLGCQAVGLGPFWIVVSTYQTLAGCAPSLGIPPSVCTETYYGVTP